MKNEFEQVRLLVRENPGNIVAVINHSGGNDFDADAGIGL